jgi:hypothetical protein
MAANPPIVNRANPTAVYKENRMLRILGPIQGFACWERVLAEEGPHDGRGDAESINARSHRVSDRPLGRGNSRKSSQSNNF